MEAARMFDEKVKAIRPEVKEFFANLKPDFLTQTLHQVVSYADHIKVPVMVIAIIEGQPVVINSEYVARRGVHMVGVLECAKHCLLEAPAPDENEADGVEI